MKTQIFAAKTDILKSPENFQHFYNSASIERRNKIDRFKFEKDKILSLGAEILLKKALAESGIYLDELRYAYNAQQKPLLIGHNDIHFNLSHSGNTVLCAISDEEIGCDVELIDEIDLNIADRFFNKSEAILINKQSGEEAKRDMFFRLWTLKESFMKATGLGFHLSPEKFSIVFDENVIRVEQSLDNKTYFFQEYDLQDGYKYACCSFANNLPNSIKMVNLK